MITINSTANPRIKALAKLRKAGERRGKGVFLIDGLREINLALQAQQEILEIFYCPEKMGEKDLKDLQNFNGELIEISAVAFDKVCYKENPDGFLAVAKMNNQKLEDIKLSNIPWVVILESVEKPGNLGAIIRTAKAAGVDALIINESQTDIYNPNVIRASEGLMFSLPIIIASTSDTISWLKKNKIKSYGAATSAKKAYTSEKLSSAIAIVLGSEAHGLSDNWLKKADNLIKIPMVKGVDSLNVSTSAAVIIFEALRQRGIK